MRKLLAATALLAAASATTIAVAQIKPLNPDGSYNPALIAQQTTPIGAPIAAPDARSMSNEADVGEARRAYRAQCEQYEARSFCECVSAGVAQALMPAEVRVAARTIGERILAQGDASLTADSDDTTGAQSSAVRIEQVEAHYADACVQFRR